MCGIFFSVRFIDNKLPEEALEERNSKIDEITRRLQQANAARGPYRGFRCWRGTIIADSGISATTRT